MALLGFFANYHYAAVGFKPTSEEFHRNPGPCEGRSTERARAPRLKAWSEKLLNGQDYRSCESGREDWTSSVRKIFRRSRDKRRLLRKVPEKDPVSAFWRLRIRKCLKYGKNLVDQIIRFQGHAFRGHNKKSWRMKFVNESGKIRDLSCTDNIGNLSSRLCG